MEEVRNLAQIPEEEQGQPVCLDGLVQEISCDIPSGSHLSDAPNIIASSLPGKKGILDSTKGSKATLSLGL